MISTKEKLEDKKDGEPEEKKSSADSGKIVNLMASKSARLSCDFADGQVIPNGMPTLSRLYLESLQVFR